MLSVLHEGPYLTKEDIAPYIVKKSPDKTIYSVVDGTRGILKITNTRHLISVNGTKMPTVSFERGPEVMIVTDGKCPFIITKKAFEKLKEAA